MTPHPASGPRPQKRRRKGSAILEFTLAMPMLVLLFSGTWAFGHGFYVYNELHKAVHAAARHASVRTYDSINSTPSSGFATAVAELAVYGSTGVENGAPVEPIAPGLTTAHVTLTVTWANGVPAAMTVAINGYPIDAMFTTFTMSGKPSATFPYMGRWAPPV
jgi:Flp pilus assembly protein TadG